MNITYKVITYPRFTSTHDIKLENSRIKISDDREIEVQLKSENDLSLILDILVTSVMEYNPTFKIISSIRVNNNKELEYPHKYEAYLHLPEKKYEKLKEIDKNDFLNLIKEIERDMEEYW